MRGLFDRARPDPEAVRRIKALVAERLQTPATTTLTVAELQCHEPGCPSVETVIMARDARGHVRDWRIAKRTNDITAADLDHLGPPE